MKIKDLTFESSYLITELNLDNSLIEYEKINSNNIKIYYDKNVNITQYNLDNKSIFLIGYCFDIRDSLKSTEHILRDLLISTDIYNELDYLNGRYNLIVFDGEYHSIYSDASQLRPLVYHPDSKTLGSHDSLVQLVLENHNFIFNKRSNRKHTELDYTRFKEIYKFNPSLYLKYETFDFVRFYPRKSLSNADLKETFEELKPYLDQSIKYLESLDNNLFLTITGGIDSRVSAALTRDFSNKVEYLTYTKPMDKLATKMAKIIYKTDENITKNMKEYLGWNHNIINLEDYLPTKYKNNINHILFNSTHSYSLANYYRSKQKYFKAVHIKSTVFGMGKADFPKSLDKSSDSFDFYKLCLHGLPKDFEKQPDFDEEIESYFKRNKIFEGVTKGRHFYDLFHLESRMGNWHSALTLETDPETEEFIFTNTRKTIDLIQQPTISERRNFSLYKMIIEKYWPVLLKFEINKSMKEKEHQSQIDEPYAELNNVGIYGSHKVSIHKNKIKNFVNLKPNTDSIKEYEQYNFSVKNNSDVSQILKISSNYSNKSGQNKIKVLINNGYEAKIYDMLDLYNGLELQVKDNVIHFVINYNKDYSKKSWIDAGRLKLEIL
ncbi:hypothetical protein [Corticicoccus populi]|uniref:Asparagine synthetase domain-containing protein n=1 Tax=Corticicoccus populi TaxID=1812821 RepID=A0ABW5WUS9_9STAP